MMGKRPGGELVMHESEGAEIMNRGDGLIRLIESDDDLCRAFPVLEQLRPHLTKAAFLERVRRQMEQGYRVAVVESGGAVRAVAGFRVAENLFSGKHVYVDDLVTDADARSKGYGRQLLDWLMEFARANGCEMLELDSGVQRAEAHRFYFREGMHIASYRFRKKL
jgi:GNAT superfamily N-acetyltransferase